MTKGALIRAFVLNELTLFPFLLSVLGGKTVHLVSVCPIFSPLQGALDRVAAFWRARGRCRLAVELVPELERLTGGERITPVMVEGDLVIVGYHGIG